jgi:fatty-acyl-CoA synthase
MVVRSAAGIERWTYRQWWERSVEVARALLACGLNKGGRVGILMTNRPEHLAAAFGTSLAGGVVVGLSTFSTPSELDHLLQASGISILLFERQVLNRDFGAVVADLEPSVGTSLPGQLESLKFPFLRRLAAVDDPNGSGAIESWSAFLQHGQSVPPALVEATAATVHPSDPGVLFFSSGTTSKPKGILNSHRGVAIQMWRWQRIIGVENVRCWPANGFFWSGVFGMALGIAFSSGGTLVLQPTFAPAEALELIQNEKVNLPLAWPHQWSRLEEAPNWNDVDLSSVRFVDRKSALARHPTVHSEWTEPRAYGVTETFTIVTAYDSGTPLDIVGESYGPVLPGNTLKVVHPLTGEIVRRGERGEIAVKGATLMLGYIGIPRDDSLDAEGFFHTGDGGYIDDRGFVYWEGRLNDIIKTGGANVSPVEVDLILNTFPGIKIGHTVGVPHETLGEMVVACAVPHDHATGDEQAIREFLKERLASYKVPRRVLFFQEQELSLTGSAKVKTAALRELVAKRLQDDAAESSPLPLGRRR